jgi:hypothetical protein
MPCGLADGHQCFGGTCCSSIHGTSLNVSSIPKTDSVDYFETSTSIKITGYRTLGGNTDMQVTHFLMITLAGEISTMWSLSSERWLSCGGSEEFKGA